VWFLMRRTETGSFQSSGRTVDYRYSRKSDTLWLRERGRQIHHSADTSIGIVDYDEAGEIVGVEIFHASEALPEIDEHFDSAEALEGPAPTVDLTEELQRAVKAAVPSYVQEARDHVKI
jgi:uncharacterized protein YuzE